MSMLLAGAMLAAQSGGGGIPSPPSGYVAWYELEDNLLDSSANGFDGAAVSTMTYADFGVGRGLDGDGTNYATLPSLGISGAIARSVCFLAKKGPINTIRTIFSCGPNVAVAGQLFIVHANVVSAGDIYVSFNNADFYTAGGVLNTTDTKRVIVTYDGSSLSTSTGVKVYVDGVSQSLTRVGSFTGVAATANLNYQLMSDKYAARAWDGFLDDVLVYLSVLSSPDRAIIDSRI